MKKLMLAAFALTAAAWLNVGLLVEPASAQILFGSLSGNQYSQTFDSLANSGTVAWLDNSTLPGWYASKTQVGAISTYRVSSGTQNNSGLYSFGVAGVNLVIDRALGSVASGTPGNLAYGVRFQNDTTVPIANITISYTGEQWRNGGNTAIQTLAFSYFISNDPITSSDAAGANAWVAFTSLDFNSPTVGATAAALDGNDPTNRQVFSATLLPNVVVFPGQEIFFRWLDLNDTGNDHALAIDDLTITFTSVTDPPVIAPGGQPQSRTNIAGTTATFTVSASSLSPMGYQWQKDGMNLTDGGEISGSSTSTLTLSTITLNDAANYTVIITNSYGSVTSGVVVLTVIQATPAIITPPTASAITYGQTLASSTLSGGVASTPGVFALVITDLAPNAGITNVSVIFTPTDTTNYTTAITSVNVTVNKATATVTLGGLYQIYDGRAKSVSVTTTPSALNVLTTYNGSSAAPTNAGIYYGVI